MLPLNCCAPAMAERVSVVLAWSGTPFTKLITGLSKLEVRPVGSLSAPGGVPVLM